MKNKNLPIKWYNMLKKPPKIECLYYDDQTGKEFIALTPTIPYTYWRRLTAQEKKLLNK